MNKLVSIFKNKTILNITIIFIIILLIGTSYIVFYFPPNDVVHREYEYKVIIETEENNSYNLIIPIPIITKKILSDVYQEIQVVFGNVTIDSIATNDTFGLMIKGRGNLSLLADDGDYQGRLPKELSLYYRPWTIANGESIRESKYLIFCNSTNTDISLEFSLYSLNNARATLTSMGGGYSYTGHYSGPISEGWNLYHGTAEGSQT